MEVGGRRRAGVKANVVAGSVWESRMKLDEVKGGIKVFTAEEKEDPLENSIENHHTNHNRSNGSSNSGAGSAKKTVRKGQGAGGSGVAMNGKRKTWKSESFDGPIQIAKGKTESLPRKGQTLADGLAVVKSPPPVQVKRGRSEGSEKNPIQGRKVRSEIKEVDEVGGQLGKVESGGVGESSEFGDAGGGNVGLNEANSEPENVLDKGIGDAAAATADDDDDKDSVVIDEDDDDDGDDEIELDEGEEEDKEIELEKQSLEIKEIGIPPEEKKTEILKTIEVSAAPPPDELKKPKTSMEISKQECKTKKVAAVVNDVRRVHQFGNRTAPPPPTTSKLIPPVIKRATVQHNIPRPTPTAAQGFQTYPETHNHSHSKLQNLVDLVMWRDISRSAFIFGIGTFIIISSSYTNGLNVSFISVISYLGLVYLASIFLYRSLICREIVDSDYGSYVVGEDEAIWILKLVLPYLNECLLKIKALFSGDPATTMKLAVLLFVFARCGNSITIWKLAKLGFFGVFTVPKVCSSYSTHLTSYGKFWMRRFRDAWESCSHKKAVALAIFTVVWNFTSTAARVWAVFMMFVAVRYYQQTMELSDDGWGEEEEGEEEEMVGDRTWQDDGPQRQISSSGPPNKIPTTTTTTSSLGPQNIIKAKGS